ncbi:hypothetical protein A2U01_0096210, partial [Trifolium medium]|nr:hypothetical protein [Trifolium medium]
SPARFLLPCGACLELGLVLPRSTRLSFTIILFSSLTLLEALVPAAHSSSYCGCAASGWCDMNGIVESLR